MGAVGVLAALAYRDRTGKGQYIEFSQAENLIRVLDWTWLFQHLTGKERERYGNRDVSICPADIFQAKDEIVAIAAATDGQFQGLCEAMGRPALARDERFATHPARLQEENAVELLDTIRKWAAGKTYEELNRLAGKHGFGAHRVSTAKDKFDDAHLVQRNFTYTVNDAIYGPVVEEGIVPKLSETPGRIKWAGKAVGFDNEYVFRRFLGLTTEQIKGLKERNVIGKWADAPGRKPPEDWDGKKGVILV
jgi:crotonobetainyl-CoA:carnitine CoA-transferase CaiB-like acyl-CoA transferase